MSLRTRDVDLPPQKRSCAINFANFQFGRGHPEGQPEICLFGYLESAHRGQHEMGHSAVIQEVMSNEILHIVF